MKSRELLSIVLSLIMVLGVSAGSAYAQTDTEIEDEQDDSRDGKYDLDDRLEAYCEMTDEEKRQLFADHPRLEQFADRLANYCNLSEDERETAIEDFIREHVPEARDYDLDDKLDRYCEMTDEEKRDLISKYDKAEDHVDRMNAYCELDEDERDAYIEEHKAKFKMNHDKSIRDKLARYCEMSDEDKRAFLAEHDKAEHAEKMNRYCELDEDARTDYIKKYKDEYKSQMKDKMGKGKHLDYDRLCALSESDRALEFDNPEKLTKVSEWCDMTPEERDAFKKEHRNTAMDFKEKRHDALNRIQENPNIPQHIKAMIMDKRDISDERMDEIKMKYSEKHGDLTDEKKSELKIKFKDHMTSMKFEMSDERKSEIHDRIAEMKAFKAELRERASEMTDEEKQELRAEFIEKAKDMQLAWISPRAQMHAGVNAAEIECREGFSLVMKESNGVAMCLKADTALRMIDRGIAVPA